MTADRLSSMPTAELQEVAGPPRRAQPSSRPDGHRLAITGRTLMTFIVVAAVAGSWVVRDRAMTGWEILLVLVAAGGYLALSLTSQERWHRTLPRRLAFLGLQLALAAVILIAFGRVGAFGTGWLLVMPLVAEGVLLLPVSGAVIVALLAWGLVEVQAWLVAGREAAVGALVPLGLAIAFVMLFTALTKRESDARKAGDALRRELAAANERLTAYAQRAEEAATERERNRLAGEIHDGLGHILTVVAVQLEAAQAVLERDPGEARAALGRAADLTREGLSEVRRAVAALRASPLDGTTLPRALARLVAAPVAGATVALEVTGEPRPMAPAVEHTVYRTAQEALTNVRKHAEASRVAVTLSYGDGEISLTVEDDGRSCHPESLDETQGFGLLAIEQRAQRLGGRVMVEPDEQGFRLQLSLPATVPAGSGRVTGDGEGTEE